MANCITRHIPNTLTCLNLFSGCIACVMAFEARYEWALAFIIFSAVFDFFDGMMARALDAHSIIGKDLDSLADDVSFGVAPSLIVFSLFKENTIREGATLRAQWKAWPAFSPISHFFCPYSLHCGLPSSTTIPARRALS